MANLEMTIPHNLPQDEAVKRIKNLLSEMKRNHSDKIADLKEDWNGYVDNFSFTAQGFNISGTLIVNRSTVNLKGKIPFAISLLKGKITKTIHEQAARVLS